MQSVSQAMHSEECKRTLRSNTEEAIKLGAFGFPYIHLHGDDIPEDCRFWFGTDRLEQVAHVLGKPWIGVAQIASKL